MKHGLRSACDSQQAFRIVQISGNGKDARLPQRFEAHGGMRERKNPVAMPQHRRCAKTDVSAADDEKIFHMDKFYIRPDQR